MKVHQILEAKYHGGPDLEDPEGWVLSVSETDRHYIDDHIVDFWASEDLGNTVWEMENNSHRIKQTTLKDGVREIYDHGSQYLYGLEHETNRAEFEMLESNFETLFERYSEKFIQGVKGGNYHFFLVPESDLFTLLALK